MAVIGFKSVKMHRYIIGTVALLQFVLLAYLLAYFTVFPNESKIELEAGAPMQNAANLSYTAAL